jgi:DNA-binding MarR family transcriptional regulator
MMRSRAIPKLTQSKKRRHPDVPNGRRHPRKRPPTSYQPKPGTLLQYGNYSLLRILSILNTAGPDGVTTLRLLEELGSKASRINDIIAALEKLELIERIEGEPHAAGQFPPVYNIITDRGKQLLQNHQLLH